MVYKIIKGNVKGIGLETILEIFYEKIRKQIILLSVFYIFIRVILADAPKAIVNKP